MEISFQDQKMVDEVKDKLLQNAGVVSVDGHLIVEDIFLDFVFQDGSTAFLSQQEYMLLCELGKVSKANHVYISLILLRERLRLANVLAEVNFTRQILTQAPALLAFARKGQL